ncbi:cupin domain-containing protein [Granulosicoccus sp. 3-233]|uniref:cupin domain-containing protein n=1 Tax=Granulosicoccus sp. 3-233 TaxID=3417969 RepID=UPI003D3360AC
MELLAELSPSTLQATIGLAGYTMRMRSVEIAPNGQIAEHSHKDRPGIVTVVQGEWIEGQPAGERTFTSQGYGTFPENEDTVHWVYNRSDAPARALVCDIAKAE